MPNILPVEQRLKFFVFVVESPSVLDLYHGRGEGNMLCQAINLNQIVCVYRLAVNFEAFRASIQIGLSEAMANWPNMIPILHISTHGHSEGIQLTSGENVLWQQLRELLVPVNQALNNKLIVCMSTCKGFAGQQMAMVENTTDHPFWALIGNEAEPTWPETAVGFATFYHLIANGQTVVDAVAAMRVSSGNARFFVTTAEQSQQVYIDYIKTINTTEVIETLEQQADNREPSEFIKHMRTPSSKIK